jgi:hypothetical protein
MFFKPQRFKRWFFPRPQVKPTLLGPIDRVSLYQWSTESKQQIHHRQRHLEMNRANVYTQSRMNRLQLCQIPRFWSTAGLLYASLYIQSDFSLRQTNVIGEAVQLKTFCGHATHPTLDLAVTVLPYGIQLGAITGQAVVNTWSRDASRRWFHKTCCGFYRILR